MQRITKQGNCSSYRDAASSWIVIVFVTANLMLSNASLAQTQIQINTDQLRSIGGTTQLDRSRFFTHTETVLPPTDTNLGNLNATIGTPAGINVLPGRISTEFDQLIADGLPEDPSRPGFIEPNALRTRIRIDYRNFVENDQRYTSIRGNPNLRDNPIIPNAFIVNSGRRDAFFPSFFNQPNSGGVPRVDAYAEFLNIFLEEAVLGPDAFVPVSPDRYAIELLNEPDFNFNSNFTRQDLVDFHREVTQAVLAVHPEANIGGPSLGATSFEENEFGSGDNFTLFEQRLGGIIADRAESGIGFYSFHPYERYDVTSQNQLVRAVDQSPGRVNGTLDLVRSRDLAENPGLDPLPIAITEYGSFNRLDGDPDIAGYTRAEQQWDLSRDIREQLLVYLNRPDVILNATPFVQGRHFTNDIPTPVEDDNVLYEQDAQGLWHETIVGSTFRAYANVRGSYIGIQDNSDDLQTVAFRDGNQVFLLLNNLLDTQQTVDLDIFTALGGIQSASIDRLFQVGEENFFEQGENVLNSLDSLVLNPEEGSVLTLTLTDDTDFGLETIEQTFYGQDTVLALNQFGNSPNFSIDAAVDGSALSATLRLTYNRPSNAIDGESFVVIVNGEAFTIDAGVLGIDDGDFGLQTRELEIPLSLLVDGENTLQVDFEGNGGFLASSALVVTSDQNFIDTSGDFDGDGNVDGDDFLAWQRGESPNPLSAEDLTAFQAEFGNSSSATIAATTVPESSSLLLTLTATALISFFRSRG